MAKHEKRFVMHFWVHFWGLSPKMHLNVFPGTVPNLEDRPLFWTRRVLRSSWQAPFQSGAGLSRSRPAAPESFLGAGGAGERAKSPKLSPRFQPDRSRKKCLRRKGAALDFGVRIPALKDKSVSFQDPDVFGLNSKNRIDIGQIEVAK